MKKYLSIIAALIFSYLVVTLLSPKVFIENSPDVDPKFIASITNLPQTIKEGGDNIALVAKRMFSGSNSNDTLVGLAADKIPTNLVFSPIAKGVVAAEDEVTKKKYVQLEKNTAYHFEDKLINGVIYKIVVFE